MDVESYREAKKKFLSGDYSAEETFRQNNCVLEYAYCKLLAGDFQSAQIEFEK